MSENALQLSGLSPFVRITLRIWAKLYASVLNVLRPFFDLFVRLTIAFGLLRSGLVKFGDWDTALNLATYEYPVNWMLPDTAATLGLSIEIIGGILLLIGLFARGSALAILLLMLVSQAVYKPVDSNLLSIALLGWTVLAGAGALSLDRLFGRGLEDSILPFAKMVVRIGTGLRRILAPVWLFMVRFWLALTLAVSSGFLSGTSGSIWLPLSSFASYAPALALMMIVLLLMGFALPLVALCLLLFDVGAMVMGMNPHLSMLTWLIGGLLLFRGGGALALDGAIFRWLQANILFDRGGMAVPAHWPHIVVVGGGFGGLACVAELKQLPVRVTLIDRNNYHLFQPLLYQIATASLSPADVATPIRGLYRDDSNVRVVLGEVSQIDTSANMVHFDGQELAYDHLVLATGATHSYFGRDDWAAFAPGLKSVDDGIAVRAKVLRAFERAEAASDPAEIARLLTFIIIGAGPTGVELAGAIAELAQFGLRNEYRHIDPASARILLVQSGARILPAFPESLSAAAAKSLEHLNVELRLNARVTDIAADGVMVGDERIAAGTILWAAGVMASGAGAWLGAETDRAGRVLVGDDLRVKGLANVFAIGDTAASNGWAGQPVPGLAPAAKQAGQYVARVIRAALSGKPPPPAFAYAHQGSLATIGRKSAVADFGRVRLHGALAWWLWGAVHVGFLVGVRNRVSVVLNWIWSYFTLRVGIRLITGGRVME